MGISNETISEGMNFFDSLFSGPVTNIIIAIVILLVGFILGKIVGRLIKKFLNEFKIDASLKKSIGLKISMENVLSSLVGIGIYLVAIVMALNQFGVTTLILTILAIAVIVLLTFSVLFAIKDTIPNFFAGLKISHKEIVKKGDIISFDKIKAKVIEVTLIETKLESKSGDILFIPNSLLLKKIITISTKSQAKK